MEESIWWIVPRKCKLKLIYKIFVFVRLYAFNWSFLRQNNALAIETEFDQGYIQRRKVFGELFPENVIWNWCIRFLCVLLYALNWSFLRQNNALTTETEFDQAYSQWKRVFGELIPENVNWNWYTRFLYLFDFMHSIEAFWDKITPWL